MDRLIESLLRYAQAGQRQLNRRRVPVDQIIESLRVTLAPLITETGAKIVCERMPAVEADPALLEELLQNLVANAIQYHRAGEAPVLEIVACNCEGMWQCTVEGQSSGNSS